MFDYICGIKEKIKATVSQTYNMTYYGFVYFYLKATIFFKDKKDSLEYNKASFKTASPGNIYLEIDYMHDMLKQKILIPFEYRRRSEMTSCVVYAVFNDDSMLNITQEPGTPYLMTNEDLGAKHILASNDENGKQHIYLNTEPKFLSEILD